MVKCAIEKSDPELRNEFYQNILITGGNSLVSGYAERLDHELSIISNGSSVLDIKKERLYSPWIGGSLLASMDTFNQLCIKREDYLKLGKDVVLQKCLL
jgi:actin-related protein